MVESTHVTYTCLVEDWVLGLDDHVTYPCLVEDGVLGLDDSGCWELEIAILLNFPDVIDRSSLDVRLLLSASAKYL